LADEQHLVEYYFGSGGSTQTIDVYKLIWFHPELVSSSLNNSEHCLTFPKINGANGQ
tara:strand:+ start:536 stop:706 length:171 start_codon:yes stop_codon:yes gene_type:complete